MIETIDDAHVALKKISSNQKTIDDMKRNYRSQIEELEKCIADIQYSADNACKPLQDEIDKMSNELVSYIADNWQSDFDGKKSKSFPEGKLWVRSKIDVDFIDEGKEWSEVIDLIEGKGWDEGLVVKKDVNKTVLKTWSDSRLQQIGLCKINIDNCGISIK